MKMKTIASLGALSILGVCVFTAGDFATAADATNSGSAASSTATDDADALSPDPARWPTTPFSKPPITESP